MLGNTTLLIFAVLNCQVFTFIDSKAVDTLNDKSPTKQTS